VPVVVAAAKDAADGFQPTNPAIVRHKVEAKGPNGGVVEHWRTWVVYQTGSCATAVTGGWEINKAAELKAVVLDSLVKPKEEKVATTDGWKALPVFALPKAKDFAGSSKVCQGFPVVMQDAAALAKGELAWVSWLEADLGASEPSGCLKGKAMGGRVRVAALGAAGVSGLAEDACPTLAGTSPLFMTPAFVVRDPASAAKDAVTGRPWMTVRAFGASLVEDFNALSVHGQPEVPASAFPITAPFMRVHPVIVDTGKVGASRYYVVGMTKKSGGTLWAQPLSDAGKESDEETWATAAKELAGVTAVCGIDAVWNPKAQEVGVVLVVRKGKSSEVWVLRKGAGAVSGPVVVATVATEVESCEFGLTAARLLALPTGTNLALWRKQDGTGSSGEVFASGVAGSVAGPVMQIPLLSALSTDDAATHLAWRGLGGMTADASGTVQGAMEAKSPIHRGIKVHTWKP
jgi:hypothetical protein